jgi:hypothetical protein
MKLAHFMRRRADMDEIGFRPCRECGKRALIELEDGNGRICARCYVRRRRAAAISNRIAERSAADVPPAAPKAHAQRTH